MAVQNIGCQAGMNRLGERTGIHPWDLLSAGVVVEDAGHEDRSICRKNRQQFVHAAYICAKCEPVPKFFPMGHGTISCMRAAHFCRSGARLRCRCTRPRTFRKNGLHIKGHDPTARDDQLAIHNHGIDRSAGCPEHQLGRRIVQRESRMVREDYGEQDPPARPGTSVPSPGHRIALPPETVAMEIASAALGQRLRSGSPGR